MNAEGQQEGRQLGEHDIETAQEARHLGEHDIETAQEANVGKQLQNIQNVYPNAHIAQQSTGNINGNPQPVQVIIPGGVATHPPTHQPMHQPQQNECCKCTTVLICVAIVVFIVIFIITGITVCFAADNSIYIVKSDNQIIHSTVGDVDIGDYVLTYNPFTNNVYWDKVLLKLHYSWFDGAYSYHQMRTLYLDDNISSITLSDDHLIYVYAHNNIIEPSIIPAQSVAIGDILFYYDVHQNDSMLLSVIDINERIMKQKRVFFTMSPYVLVNNIVASPYTGPDAGYHHILHFMYTHLIWLRFYINCTILSSIACVGYCVLLYWFKLCVALCFCVCVMLETKRRL